MFCNLGTGSFSKKNDLEPSCCSVYVYPAVEKDCLWFFSADGEVRKDANSFTGLCVEVTPVKK